MAGWRDRAVKVEEPTAPAAAGGWRSRAREVEAPMPELVAMAPTAPAPAPEVDMGTAAARGALQGSTLGWSDEALGFLMSKLPEGTVGFGDTATDLGARWKSILAGGGGGLPSDSARQRGTYEEERDKARALNKATREAQPEAYFGGELAGGIASNVALPVGRAAAVGTGAVSGLGSSEADSAGGMAFDTALGAGLGYAGDVIGEQIGRRVPALFRSARESLKDTASENALKAAGYIQKDLKPMIRRDPDSVRRAGQALLEEPGLITPGARVGDIESRLGYKIDAYGDQIGRVREAADALGARFDIEPLLQRIEADVLEPIAGDPAVRREANELRRLVSGYRKLAADSGGDLGFQQANDLKTRLQKTINFGNHFATGGPSEQAERFIKQLQGMFSDELDRQLDLVVDPGDMAAYRDAMGRYGILKETQDKARQGIAREGGNATFGLRDSMAAGIGSILGGPAGAMAAPVLSKLATARGPSTTAALANAVSHSDWLQTLATSNPEALGKWGARLSRAAAQSPEALSMAHYLLAQEDPAYQQHLQQLATGNATSPQ